MIKTDAFTDRASWLAYRADWRARYAEVTQEIRSHKRDIAALRAQRRSASFAAEGEQFTREADSMQNYVLVPRRRSANGMMIELEEAKAIKNKMLKLAEDLAA